MFDGPMVSLHQNMNRQKRHKTYKKKHKIEQRGMTAFIIQN